MAGSLASKYRTIANHFVSILSIWGRAALNVRKTDMILQWAIPTSHAIRTNSLATKFIGLRRSLLPLQLRWRRLEINLATEQQHTWTKGDGAVLTRFPAEGGESRGVAAGSTSSMRRDPEEAVAFFLRALVADWVFFFFFETAGIPKNEAKATMSATTSCQAREQNSREDFWKIFNLQIVFRIEKNSATRKPSAGFFRRD